MLGLFILGRLKGSLAMRFFKVYFLWIITKQGVWYIMSSVFWFTSLAMIGIGMAAFSMYKKRCLTELSTWIVFFLFATSITWLGEFTVLGLFNSYAYKPGLFNDSWAENLAGHLILNSTLWPGMAVLVAAYSLDYKWICLLSAGNVLIEYFFVKFGMYDQHWWKYYMTAIAVVLYLAITKKWFSLLNQKRYGLIRFLTLYFAAFVIIHLPFPLLLLSGKQFYYVDLAQNLYRSSTVFILFYHLVETFIVIAFSYFKNWYWKLVPFISSFLGQIILVNRGILVFQDGWNLFYNLLIYVISITICILLEKHTLKPRINMRVN
jgi:hypothetical protein